MYTSYCEDNDEVTIFYNKKYEVGDYLLSSGEVIKNADYVDQDVIGVCVIPDNFISKTGVNSKARFCALTESTAKYKTSNTEDTGLSKFNKFGCVGESNNRWTPTNTLAHNGDYGYISGQGSHFKYESIENPYDPGAHWRKGYSYHHIASPYLYVNDEYVFNEGVYNGCVGDAVSMLSDMDGKANTGIINDSDHPAAKYCATYSTNGTSAGDWYLPAMGELAFIMARFDTINEAISNVSGTPFNLDGGYFSSTQNANAYACGIATYSGQVKMEKKNSDSLIRSFLRLD